MPRFLDTSAALEVAAKLESDEEQYKSQVRLLTLQFLQKRLANSAVMEEAKQLAADRLREALLTDDLPVSMLLRIIDSLGTQNTSDLNSIMTRMSGSGQNKQSGDVYNIFNTSEAKPAQQVNISPETFKLLDNLVQISESLTKKDQDD